MKNMFYAMFWTLVAVTLLGITIFAFAPTASVPWLAPVVLLVAAFTIAAIRISKASYKKGLRDGLGNPQPAEDVLREHDLVKLVRACGTQVAAYCIIVVRDEQKYVRFELGCNGMEAFRERRLYKAWFQFGKAYLTELDVKLELSQGPV